MNKRILITGTNGFIGARALNCFPEAEIVPSSLVHNPTSALIEFVTNHNPDIIINCAAISDIGECEKNPDASYTSNVVLPVALAKSAKNTGAKLINFSSDQVYTGCFDEGPYDEDIHLPPPANTYARHKLEAEGRVLDISPDSVILRATWMYDMPLYNHKNRSNFLVNTLNALLNKKEMVSSSLEYRGITYAREVVSNLEKTFSLPGGVYNYGSENSLNMYDTQKALLAFLGADDTLLSDNKSNRHNLWINCDKLKKNGIFFDTTTEGFSRCIKDYRLKF